MRKSLDTLRRLGVAGLVVSMIVALLTAVGVVTAGSAAAAGPVPPVLPRTPNTMTADALPTVQVNGVVWEMATVGNTVYAGGNFTKARPAGSAAGQNEVTRNNLLAFDLTTGNLITSFVPDINGPIKGVAGSPDGKTLYVAGAAHRGRACRRTARPPDQ